MNHNCPKIRFPFPWIGGNTIESRLSKTKEDVDLVTHLRQLEQLKVHRNLLHQGDTETLFLIHRLSITSPTTLAFECVGFCFLCLTVYIYLSLSTTAHYAEETGNLVSFSPQQVVDCSKNSGCNGGYPTVAYE